MKKLITIIALFVACHVNAATYYIDPSGSDITGNGTIGNPWKTLYKATSTITTPGNIIHVNAGTYPETLTSNLAVGVSIEGVGITSLITSTVGGATDGSFVPTINVGSSSSTVGKQHISGIKLDGQMAASWGIWVAFRDSVQIFDCTVVNFYNFGVSFTNTNDLWTIAPPTTYRLGNIFHDNIVTNCANYEGWGRGCLNIGGQTGMLVYNNTITQDSRATGHNGWPIKYANDGYTRGLKIYNNTLTKNLRVLNSNDWSFCMEIFNGQGTEIYGNTMQGSMDFNFQGDKGTYPYVVYIHDNVCSIPAVGNGVQEAVIMEYSVDGLIIENNTFNNLSHAICFYPRAGALIKNVYIKNNLVSNLGSTSSSPVFIFGFDALDITTRNFNILNNTVSNDTTPNHNSDFMMNFTGGGNYVFDSLIIKNNIFKGFSSNVAFLMDVTKFTHSEFAYNDINGKDEYGGHNNLIWTPTWGSGYVGYPGPINIHHNLAGVEPRFNGAGNYTLQSSSPLIDAGTNVGSPYSGNAPDMGYKEYAVGGNISPYANAGSNQTITLPTSSVTLTGSGTDPDGTIASYAWTRVSGPNTPIIVSSTSATTSVTGLIQGIYIFNLQVTDNNGATGNGTVQVTVNITGGNVPPTANAGPDQNLTAPTGVVSLTGSGADSDGTISAYNWSLILGNPCLITNAGSANTTVTGLTLGTYKFELKVTDNNGATARDTMQINVSVGGTGCAIINPSDKATLLVLSNSNTTVSGGTTGAWASARSDKAIPKGKKSYFEILVTATGNVYGLGTAAQDLYNYVGSGLYGWCKADNTTHYHNAGNDFTGISVSPGDYIGVAVDATDTTNIKMWYAVNNTWENGGNPTAGTGYQFNGITGTVYPAYSNYNATGSATFNFGGTAFHFPAPAGFTSTLCDTVSNISPSVNAGPDQAITLPTSTVTVSGTGTDADGTIAVYAWTKLSGPTGGTITSSSNATTSITSLTAGTYKYRLTVTDNLGATAYDELNIVVSAAIIPGVKSKHIFQYKKFRKH